MSTSQATGLPYIEEGEADARTATLFATVKREMQVPFVPNWMKAIAASSAALEGYWGLFSNFTARTTIPASLQAMICYAVASSNNCRYCAAGNELSCRIYGIDDDTLNALVKDLDNVSPQRLQAIIKFALQVAHDPQSITRADYDALRAHGVADEEIIEIVIMAGIAQLNDIMADSLKIEVDPGVAEALGIHHTG